MNKYGQYFKIFTKETRQFKPKDALKFTILAGENDDEEKALEFYNQITNFKLQNYEYKQMLIPALIYDHKQFLNRVWDEAGSSIESRGMLHKCNLSLNEHNIWNSLKRIKSFEKQDAIDTLKITQTGNFQSTKVFWDRVDALNSLESSLSFKLEFNDISFINNEYRQVYEKIKETDSRPAKRVVNDFVDEIVRLSFEMRNDTIRLIVYSIAYFLRSCNELRWLNTKDCLNIMIKGAVCELYNLDGEYLEVILWSSLAPNYSYNSSLKLLEMMQETGPVTKRGFFLVMKNCFYHFQKGSAGLEKVCVFLLGEYLQEYSKLSEEVYYLITQFSLEKVMEQVFEGRRIRKSELELSRDPLDMRCVEILQEHWR